MNRLCRWLVGQVQRARGATVAAAAIVTATLLCVPVLFALAKLPPNELFARYYSLDFEAFAEPGSRIALPLAADGEGFALSLRITESAYEQSADGSCTVSAKAEPEDEGKEPVGTVERPTFGFTRHYLTYADAHTRLIMPVDSLPAWAIEERDFRELFDRLALYNGYFGRFLAPTVLLCMAIIGVMLLLFYFGIGYLMGLTRMRTHSVAYRLRVKSLLIGSAVPAALCFPIGLIMPVMHIFLFQLLAVLLGYAVLRRL